MSNKRKKILLMSDDLRMTSGIARMSREIVEGTIHKYDWVQISGAVQHPDKGKIVKIESDDHFKLPDSASITLYPVDGYGSPDVLKEVMAMENPDAILHFTDPRFWIWLYHMEHEIRQSIPIMYYNIWDDLPDPMYNTNYYRSCDLLMGISKQTYGINKRLCPNYEDWQVKYVPHGISTKRLFKVNDDNIKFKQFEMNQNLDKYKFKILYLNRNIRRKMPGDVVLAYKHFMDGLTKEQQKECCLVFHTAPVDENGTDLPAVCKAIIPNYNVLFPDTKFNDEELNLLYNSCDVYINMASNEGFGLGSAESLMTETPIIVNVTGGLQDQCGFKNEKDEYLTEDDYSGEWGSNHNGRYQEHGEWVKPIFPATLSLVGSPPTPYIFDDRCRWDDAGDAIRYWYDKTPEERDKCGKSGKEYLMRKETGMSSDEMCNRVMESIDGTFKEWKPRDKYVLEVV
jgi:glycosyltransferase involved in cell wall biosynthesis